MVEYARYRQGTGRYIDSGKTVYVVEDEHGMTFRFFRAGMVIADGSIRRGSRGTDDLVVAYGELGTDTALRLAEGRTGEWAVGGVSTINMLFKPHAGPRFVAEPRPAPDPYSLPPKLHLIYSRLLWDYVIARGPKRNVLFGGIGERTEGQGDFKWRQLHQIPHPNEQVRQIATEFQSKPLITQLLRAAPIAFAGSPMQPQPKDSRIELRGDYWYRVSGDSAEQIALKGDGEVVDIGAFSRTVLPFGWGLGPIRQVVGVLSTGDSACMPVADCPPTHLWVPWADNKPRHLILAVKTLHGGGVGGISLLRFARGTVRSGRYHGPHQPPSFLCNDGTVIILPY